MKTALRRLAMLSIAASTIFSVAEASVVMTFDGLLDNEGVLSFYSGGSGEFGSTAKANENFGVTFGEGVYAYVAGGIASFSGNPSDYTVALFSTFEHDLIMNVPGGFNSVIAYFYATAYEGSTVSLYSGENGSGTLLATKVLAALDEGENTYDVWAPDCLTFSGTAKSAVFTGFLTGFDNLMLGPEQTSGDPQNVTVPEPTSLVAWLLLAVGTAGVVVARRQIMRSTRLAADA